MAVFGPLPDPAANTAALRIAATVLSILSGFLIATITLAGDPKALLPGSWRLASAHRNETRRVLDRFAILFYAYLCAIVVVFCAAMLGPYLPQCAARWLGHAGLSIGLAALVWSFGLPAAIRSIQLDRLDAAVRERHRADIDADVRRTDEPAVGREEAGR